LSFYKKNKLHQKNAIPQNKLKNCVSILCCCWCRFAKTPTRVEIALCCCWCRCAKTPTTVGKYFCLDDSRVYNDNGDEKLTFCLFSSLIGEQFPAQS